VTETQSVSATLAINQEVRRRQRSGEDVVHLGFGEAGLPVHPILRKALEAASGRNSYGDVAGSDALRASVASAFSRRGVATEPEQIVAGPGSKALLYALFVILDGDVVLPRPAWVSYRAQAQLLGKKVIDVEIPASAGGIPDPMRLREAVTQARRGGFAPGIVLLTHPDNPTGTFADRTLLQEVLATARESDLRVVADEIYAELAFAPEAFVSAASLDPDNVVVTSGLSKSHAVGGWRLGIARLPGHAQDLVANLVSVGSEIWSCMPSPIDAAAAVAYSDPEPLVEFVAAARALHAAVAQAAYDIVSEVGARCRSPRAGFYLYPDFAPLESGVQSGADLSRLLIDRYGVATLPGSSFGDPFGVRLRLATSLLYGRSEAERWEALAAGPAAVELPWIARPLERLRDAITDISKGS
jgi:aspartate aminotransferase